MSGLFTELKRRNVFRVGVLYAIVAWILLQIADVVVPALGIPEWSISLILLLLVLGLPIALIFAWAFEITPEGIKREKDVDRSQSITPGTGRKIDHIIIGVLAIAVIGLLADRFLFDGKESADPATSGISGSESPGPAQTKTADRRSIAVIPFDNRSADEEDAEFFSEGIHDDILTLLSKIRELKVISRTSVQKYKETNKTIPEIGSELGVATVLEGGVQRAGDRVRINVQLIDVATDEHLWAETYNRELTAENIFDVQGEIATAVTAALQATLTDQEQEQLSAVLTDNLEAYESFMLAKRKIRTRNTQDLFDGAELFKKAFTLDPDFSQAYAGYAGALLLQESYTEVEYNDIKPEIERAVDAALRLDPNMAEVYAVKGLMGQFERRLDDAEKYYREAIKLNPNYVRAYHWMGVTFRVYMSRYEEALDLHMKALEMDPLSPIINFNVAADLDALGRTAEAMSIYKREAELNPAGSVSQTGVGWLYWLYHGDYQKALEIFSEVMLRDTGFAGAADSCALMLLDLGLDEQAVAMTNRVPGTRHIKSSIIMAREYNSGASISGIDRFEQLMSEPSTEWDATFQSIAIMLQIMHASDNAANDNTRALALYRKYFPQVFAEPRPKVIANNATAALHVARLLQESGETESANELLEAIARNLAPRPVRGAHGKGFSGVALLALQGQTDAALDRLREILDTGYAAGWYIHLVSNPNLESIANEPRFQAMIKEIEANMAQKRSAIEASGVLASL